LKPVRWATAALAVALLTSCSTTKLVYNRLDWLVSWEIGKYVELEGRSKLLFESGFTELWHWHRSTQLAAYAKDLREIADAAQGPVDEAQLRGWFDRADVHAGRLFDEALPPTAQVLQSLDDAQVAGMLERMAEQRKEEAEDEAEQTPEEALEHRVRGTTRGLRRWLGSVTEAQKGLVRDWAASRRDNPEIWRRYGESWSRAFEQALAARAEPGFEARLRKLFTEADLPEAPEVEAINAHNRDAFIGFLTRLAPTLDAKQRRRFHSALTALAEDLEELAAQAKGAREPETPAASAGGMG
jgi:hypothetical protein